MFCHKQTSIDKETNQKGSAPKAKNALLFNENEKEKVRNSYCNAKRTRGKLCNALILYILSIYDTPGVVQSLENGQMKSPFGSKRAYILEEETKMAKLLSLSTCDRLYTTVGCSRTQSLVSFSVGPHVCGDGLPS